MIGRQKKISNGSEPTQPERSQRFIRRNSIHTLHCRQGSLKKYQSAQQQLFPSTPTIQFQQPLQNPQKSMNILCPTQQNNKDLPPSFTPVLKKASGSMKIDPTHHMHGSQSLTSHQCANLHKQLEIKDKQNQHLQLQCNRYKNYLSEQKEKRKILQQQIRCNRQEIKRLQKRLQKYKTEKEKYQTERQIILKHMDELQTLKLDSKTREIQSYQLTLANHQIANLRQQLAKDRTKRQKELAQQLQKYIEYKYTTENQLKSANIANTTLSKQIQQLESQMQVLQSSIHKAVTESYQYQQLRQKYKIMLIEFKQLREEMSILQNANRSNSMLSNTLLTVSANSLLFQQ